MGKTRGVHETTPEIRNRMVGMYEAGLGLREIAAAVNCSQRTVKRWLNRFDKEGNVETRDRCGRKRATTEEQDEAIVRLATQTPITAAKAVLPALGLNCSVDTVRERLHKAGIHNWSPSRKQIQKIPIAISDGLGIQQAVWRPTGTQLGKKKLSKEANKSSDPQTTKKKATQPTKAQSKRTSDNSELARERTEEQPNFSFSPPVPRVQEQQPQINQVLLPPPPPPPPVAPTLLSHSTISVNPSQYGHPLNSLAQPQPLYQHHPGLSISQNWPLDLVQSTHPYSQSLQHPIHQHEQQQHSPLQLRNHAHLQSNNAINDDVQQSPESHMQSSVHPLQNFNGQQKLAVNHQTPHQSATSESSSHEKSDQPQVLPIASCSDLCSNSNSSCSNDDSRNSSCNNETSNDDRDTSSKVKRSGRVKSNSKKGGKVKGTLETSVEIRNRMIGMSEAGLSTLSIALAINRSERTVKRWLDRWRREGNVQTKERKGRRRITTKEQDDAIIAMATQQPLTAAKHVAPALGLKCSVDTIRERLHKAGIHSWKLGKKPGEGNAVHTVHLWQPSGNRSNKIKSNGGKKKKSSSKARSRTRQANKKQTTESSTAKAVTPMTNVSPDKTPVQYQNPPQSSPVMQTSQELSSPAGLVQTVPAPPAPVPVCPSNLAPNQSLQPLGPTMQQQQQQQQQRPDCRLSLSAIVPAMPGQLSSNVPSYPSCMMGGGPHTGHMEQSDPMNYEPYIWSF